MRIKIDKTKHVLIAVEFMVIAVFVMIGVSYVQRHNRNEALYEAVKAGDTKAVASLLSDGADPKYVHTVFLPGNSELAKLKYNLGFRSAASAYGGTIVMQATCQSNSEIMRMLLIKGVDPNSKPDGGLSMLSCKILCAVSLNQASLTEALQMIIDFGGKVNDDRYFAINPLTVVAWVGRNDAVKFLIAHGANVNAGTSNVGTALEFAAMCGRQEVVKTLLANDADPTIASKANGLPIDAARKYGYKGIVAMLKDAMAKRKGGESDGSSTKKK
ncbi:MAG: ankyrin repeat domain-containing protein [Chthonomonadales bacterium]